MLVNITRVFTCLIIFGWATPQLGYTQVRIVLKPSQWKVDAPSFYIQEVVDGRKDPQNIGYTKNGLDEKVAIKLSPDLSKAIQVFVNQSLVKNPEAAPITLQVLYLKLKEEQTSTSEVTARAEIKLAFYEKEATRLKRIYVIEHYEDEVFPTSGKSRILDAQEKRIRGLLEHCLTKFGEERETERLKTEYVDPKVLDKPSTIDQLEITKGKSLGHWHNLITFKRSMGHHTQGWQVSYIGFSNREEIIVPFIFSLGQSQTKEATIRGSEYRVVDAYTFSFGSQVYIQLLPNFYANVTLNIPIGIEMLRDRQEKRSQNFLIGIGSKQGLMYIPKSSLGLVLGGGVYQRLQTSRMFSTDWGFELSIGIKF
ncbi:MAG TPA: hypothetical protein DCS93_43165 [Microscillaceae bacterium]|nr:hypothetical protein [Microscillaceae bacterium]